MKSSRTIFSAMAAFSFLILSSGCSSFRHDAKAASRTPPTAGSIEGLWEGRWSSAKNPKHGGKMEMVLTKTGDTLYRASTRSHWWRLFRSSYDTQLVVTPVGPGEFLIMGGKNIWGFGGYSITGRVDSAKMDAGFQVGSDLGQITLARPADASSH